MTARRNVDHSWSNKRHTSFVRSWSTSFPGLLAYFCIRVKQRKARSPRNDVAFVVTDDSKQHPGFSILLAELDVYEYLKLYSLELRHHNSLINARRGTKLIPRASCYHALKKSRHSLHGRQESLGTSLRMFCHILTMFLQDIIFLIDRCALFIETWERSCLCHINILLGNSTYRNDQLFFIDR